MAERGTIAMLNTAPHAVKAMGGLAYSIGYGLMVCDSWATFANFPHASSEIVIWEADDAPTAEQIASQSIRGLVLDNRGIAGLELLALNGLHACFVGETKVVRSPYLRFVLTSILGNTPTIASQFMGWGATAQTWKPADGTFVAFIRKFLQTLHLDPVIVAMIRDGISVLQGLTKQWSVKNGSLACDGVHFGITLSYETTETAWPGPLLQAWQAPRFAFCAIDLQTNQATITLCFHLLGQESHQEVLIRGVDAIANSQPTARN